MTKKQTIAEALIEEPITSNFKLWRWTMRITKGDHDKKFRLLVWFDAEWLMKNFETDCCWDRLLWYFQSFEEAYEWMLAFLEAVMDWKTFTYDID